MTKVIGAIMDEADQVSLARLEKLKYLAELSESIKQSSPDADLIFSYLLSLLKKRKKLAKLYYVLLKELGYSLEEFGSMENVFWGNRKDQNLRELSNSKI